MTAASTGNVSRAIDDDRADVEDVISTASAPRLAAPAPQPPPPAQHRSTTSFAAALASRLREPVADLEEREPKATYALYDLVAGEPEKVTYGYLEDDVAALETEDDILESKS